MARFIVLGNCATESISRCLRVLHPQGYVEAHDQVNLRADFGNEDSLFAHLRSFDYVVLQAMSPGMLGILDADVIRANFKNTLNLPGIVFTGFHPDIVYARPKSPEKYGHRFVRSPLGEYQSALAVYGFLTGLNVNDTCALFRRDVFETLGYLRVWDEAQTFMLNAYKQYGWNIDRYFLRWSRLGVFMHSSNHAKLYVCADIARMILTRCEIPFERFLFEDYMTDPLCTGPVWPVYPAVAAAYGLAGSMQFKRIEIDNPLQLFLNLEEFIAGCHEELAKVGVEEIDCARPQEWIATNALAGLPFPARP